MMTPTSQLGHVDCVGFRFNPTDYEIVHHFLRDRVNLGAKSYSHPVIHECPEFFGKEEEPWQLWQRFGGSLEPNKQFEPEITLYFFTKRKRQSVKSARFDRRVGSGTWSGQNPKPIYGDEEESVVIGTKREFRYEGGFDEGHNNAWLMQEYEIVVGDHFCCDEVLCTLRKSPRKAPPSRQCVVIGDNKRKMTSGVAESKAKRHKKRQSCDGGAIVGKTNLEIGQGFHPMLQIEMPSSSGSHYQNDEFVVEDALPIPQTPTSCDESNNNNLSFPVCADIGQEEETQISLGGSIVDQREIGGMDFELGGSLFMDDNEFHAALDEMFKYADDHPPSGSSSVSTDLVTPQTPACCDEKNKLSLVVSGDIEAPYTDDTELAAIVDLFDCFDDQHPLCSSLDSVEDKWNVNNNLSSVVSGDVGQGENGTVDDQQKMGGIGFEWDGIDLSSMDHDDLFTFDDLFKSLDDQPSSGSVSASGEDK